MMRAGVLWMLMVCLSGGRATDLQGCQAEPTVFISKAGKVSISCPSIMAKTTEFRYQLLFNSSPINEIDMTKQEMSGRAGSVSSVVFEVTANSSGVYSCSRESLYPPPHQKQCLITEVMLGGNQTLSVTNQNVSVTNQTSPVSSLLIPELALWVGCGILLIYSLSITCFAACIWRKMKKVEKDSSVYVNTRTWEKSCKA